MKRIIYGLFATLLIGLFSVDAGAAIAVGAKRIDHFSGVTTATTTGITTTASGSTFVVAVSFDHTTHIVTGISDSKSNTYTLAGTAGDFGSVYYCSNCTGGASHTVTITFDGAEFPIVHFLEITGAATSSYDSAVTAKAEDAASPFTVTSGTTSQAAELLVSFIASNSGSNPVSYSESSGFTIQQQDGDGSNYWTSALATRIVSSTGTFTPSYTGSGITGSTNIVIGLKEAASGGSSTLSPGAASLAFAGATSAISTSGNKVVAPAAASLAVTGATSTISKTAYTWYSLPSPGGYDNNSILVGQTYPTGSWLRVVTDFAHITADYATGPLQNDLNDYATAAGGYSGTDSATYEIKNPSGSTSQYTITVNIDSNALIGFSAATVSFTPSTPSIVIGKVLSPSAAALAFAGSTSTITATANKSVAPSAAALALSPATPTITASGSVSVSPSAVSLVLTSATPSIAVTANKTVAPSAASLALSGATPTVAATANVVVAPSLAALAFTPVTPNITVGGNASVTPGAGALVLTGAIPSIAITANQTFAPTAAAIALSGATPSITATANIGVAPNAAALAFTPVTPNITVGGNASVTPGAAGLAFSGAAPSVGATANVAVNPSSAALTFSGAVSTVTATTHSLLAPAAAALNMVGSTPAVSVTRNIMLAPASAAILFFPKTPRATTTAHTFSLPPRGSGYPYGSRRPAVLE